MGTLIETAPGPIGEFLSWLILPQDAAALFPIGNNGADRFRGGEAF